MISPVFLRMWHSCALALAVAAVGASAQVYKSTDANGRVQYSDKPPPGAARVAPGLAAGNAAADMQGRWLVANATLNGELYIDKKISGQKWTIRGNELTIETAEGERGRYTLTFEPNTQPRAFSTAPIAPSRERTIPMIYEREGERLRVAYFDGREAKPTSFAPQQKLAVITLTPLDAASGARAATAARIDPCGLLRAAGVDALFGGAPTVATPGTPDPTSSCKVEDAVGIGVTLVVVRAATSSILERERAKASADSRNVVRDETLGAGAFSSAR